MYAIVLLFHVVRGDHSITADRHNGRLQLCEASSLGAQRQAVGLGLVSLDSVAVDNARETVVADEHQIKRCSAASPGALCETVVGSEYCGAVTTEPHAPEGGRISKALMSVRFNGGFFV